MHALRTAYEDVEGFVEYVDGVLRPGGHRIMAAFVGDREGAAAVAGFRVADSLGWAHHLYVDDLSTLPEERRRGRGRALLDRLAEASRRGTEWGTKPHVVQPISAKPDCAKTA